jgi:hypothetical protein
VKAKSMKKVPAPVNCSAVPKSRKPMTNSANARIGTPSTLSREKMWKAAVSSSDTEAELNGPGT